MAAAAEQAALQTCLANIKEMITALEAENAVALTAPNKVLVVDLIRYLKSQHLQLALDVPDGLIPTQSINQSIHLNGSDSDSDGGADGNIGQIGHTPNLGMVLNLLIHNFNGENGYSVDVFLHDVSQVCRRRQITGVAKLEIAFGKIRDPALSLVRDLNLNRLTSWTEFKAQMLELFSEVLDLSSLTLQISRCKQRADETVTAFSVRMYTLLLKKARFCDYASDAAFKVAIDKEAIAVLQLGLHNPEVLKVIRRSDPQSFKDAVRTAKMEEMALKDSNENSQLFFKQVKIAAEVPPDQRAERQYNRSGTPVPYERNNYQDNGNYGRNNYSDNRNFDRNNYRNDDRNYSRNNQNFDERGRNNGYYQQRNQGPEQNFRPRGRSREQDYNNQRRPRSKSGESARGQNNNTPQQQRRRFSVPCNCKKCAHLFPPTFVFSRVECYNCGFNGHLSRNCVHPRAQEEASQPRNNANARQVHAINTPDAAAQPVCEDKALVSYPIQAHVEDARWQTK